MPVVDIYNQKHESVGNVELNDAVFATEVKEHIFHLVVRYQLAKRRAGTHSTLNRSNINGGGRKPFRQKGTGRARQGTIRATQMRGGAIPHGPKKTANHAISVPKRVRRAALRMALTRRLEDQALWVLDNVELPEAKTRNFKAIVDAFGWDQVLLVLAEQDEAVSRSARNIPGVLVLPVEGLNVYDILRHKNLALTQGAVDALQTRLGS